jgi:predicted XRE-type DNA-binding protein
MKITAVVANARKRCFEVTIKGRIYEFPYALLDIKPSSKNPIATVALDKEVGSEAFQYQLKNGSIDTVLAEQVLHFNQDPDVIRKELLYKLSCSAQKLVDESGISKRAVARGLGIQPAQLYRLLDQSFYGKSIDQMVRLFASLGKRIEITVRKAA